MKRAWETMNPGRAQKALESRRRFLDSLGIIDYEQYLSVVETESTAGLENNPTNEETSKSSVSSSRHNSNDIDSSQSGSLPSNMKRSNHNSMAKRMASKENKLKEIEKEVIINASNANEEELFLEAPFVRPTLKLPSIDLHSLTK